MSRQWDENLCFGDAAIDKQHRTILEQYELLSVAVQEGNSAMIIDKLTKFLHHYTDEHFVSEELIMLKYRYPRRDEHRQEHDEFSQEVEHLKKRIKEEGVSRTVAVAATGVLYRYIVNHVNKSDMELALFIRGQSGHAGEAESLAGVE